jgi:hypothetical protein
LAEIFRIKKWKFGKIKKLLPRKNCREFVGRGAKNLIEKFAENLEKIPRKFWPRIFGRGKMADDDPKKAADFDGKNCGK